MSTERPTVEDRVVADTEPVPGERTSRTSPGMFPDRYEAGTELGRGGMGRVVEAHDKMLGRTVALKEALDTDADALRRFARETQITARLEHPAIVPVYDAGVSPDGSPFYVMRKVTGRPLDKLVAASKHLNERLALLPHVMAACQAVAHAHERGIIHRDLKPANILVGARGETIVIDWGLAKAIDETDPQRPSTLEPEPGESLHTRAGAVFGTPGFMSPEQHASSSEVDERADVFALGATLYYMLATRVPALPPEPIAGVPRELAAIIDKALSADLQTRYRNAGALAEDLSRFMTGQLVAAHAYTTRERVWRFVRRHRALVITVGAAALVVAIGAFIAVGRVVSARDEAIDQAHKAEVARAREAERASDLVISQARLLLTTNPTGAIAMVRPLASSARWREVRAIGAGARSAGVARKLPAPATITMLDLGPDGIHALAVGGENTIHTYDLVARTHEVIATFPDKVRARFVDDKRVLAWSGKKLTLIDLATNATKTFEHVVPILRIEPFGDHVYFVDDMRGAWRLDLATGAIIEIRMPGRVDYIAVSPNGKRVAFSGEHLWLIDEKRPDLVEKIHDGKKFELAWSPDGEHLAVIGPQMTYDITVHPEIDVHQYQKSNQTAVLARGLLYTAGIGGMTIGDRGVGESDLASAMSGLWVTRGEFVIGAGRDNLRLFDGKREYQVPLPAGPVTALRASPRSPYIIAVCGGLLLQWNVEDMVPKRIEVPSYSQIATVGRDRAWAITNSGGGQSIDLQTGKATEIAKLPTMRFSSPASGAFVIARPAATYESLVIRADGSSEAIPIDADYASVFDGTHAMLGSKKNEVVLYDVENHTSRVVGKLGNMTARLLAREVNPRWLVAVDIDGTVVRYDLTANTSTTTKVGKRTDLFAPGLAVTAAMPDGTTFVAMGTRVRRWPVNSDVVDHVTLPSGIHAIHLLDDSRLLVVGDSGNGYIVRTDRPEFLRLPSFGLNYSWGLQDPTLVVTDDRTGGVTVLDVEANAAWKIARATPSSMTPDISGDGKVVVMRDATLDSTAVAIWSLDLPSTPEATAKWIDDLTNATFDPRTGMIGWPL